MKAEAESNALNEGGVRITAVGLNKWVRKDLNILGDISLHFEPNEFIVIVGQSGGGKSTLLDALSGYRPATHGSVYVNYVDVYENYDAIRSITGYVPQKDIIHMELTVYEALDYAALLRLPRGTSKAERHRRVMDVLEELDLVHRKDVRVSGLSGGQQKRVSIGVELLTRPRLFFLDEPTSGLDPGTETSLMLLLRRLADQGRTIVLITHATKNVMLADKVVFLARGGYLAWFGPPKEALDYFAPYRSQGERFAQPMGFDEIYAILDTPGKGTPGEWAQRYRQSQAFQAYVQKGLDQLNRVGKIKTTLRDRILQAKENYLQHIPPVRQFLVLSGRNLRILSRDRVSMLLMLLAPLVVGCLDFLIAHVMGRSVFDYNQGAPMSAVQSLFLLSLYVLMVSSLSQMREFTKETAIYLRERMVNLRLVPYVASKIWVAVLLAILHSFTYLGIRYFTFEMPGGQEEFWMMAVTLFMGVFASMLLGLVASAISPSQSTAPMITILLIIPTIVLSGALVNLPEPARAVSTTHWTFRGLVEISGLGADVAADDCWGFPKELRQAMTVDDKKALECRCMGENMFDPNSCYFPGMGKIYTPAIDQPMPEKPPDLGAPPENPELPPAPQEPEDNYDKVAVAEYLNALQDYQQQVAQIQDDFKQKVGAYQMQSEIYQAQMMVYQAELAAWYVARAASIGAGEGNISALMERFAWAFVSKDDPQSFRQAIYATWEAQGIIIIFQVLLIFFSVRRKDARR